MRLRFLSLLLIALAACSSARREAPPVPASTPPPVLIGQTVMVFPVQHGFVPVSDSTVQHYTIDTGSLDSELSYWLPQSAANVRWVLPATIQRSITRSPTLAIDIQNLEVSSFRRGQVKRIGDPLFGDLRKLASVLDARIAVIPVASEAVGKTPADSRVQIATAVIDAMSGDVIWFGIHEATETGHEQAGLASAAQVFARAFSGRRN
jgi:hypothetical protein